MKTTGSYVMINKLTGTYHRYYLWRNTNAPIDINKALLDTLSRFPAYTDGIMSIYSNVIVSDYKGRIYRRG